ncbi:DUF4388 domain-containing protein [Thermomicrobium sp. 4228-Ro]|uniref:DUF4388 domain-containing protein n=1 Tax=Thermomicrobium sp. 4228-Ro TaxID=2993937 RepID=UPI002248A3B6|nr:DUF4388 domain-containing protein [Thermomicrobium sp. 4228-Ro]MCX2727842.1 DUF4388 domain-containing protein [Thermomicrobium sp. 4228-Ro]
MPIYGDLSDLPLHLLLQALMRAGQTGSLTLRTRLEEITLLFDRGRIAAVVSSDVQLRLGQMLLQLGEITEEQLEQALALQAVSATHRRLGELLVELGFVTHQQIKRALANQFEEVLVRVITAPDATFAFVPEPAAALTDETVLDDAPATKLILNAIRRADELTAPIQLATVVPDPSVLDQLVLEEREVLLALLEGNRTLRQVVQATGLAPEVVREVLERLRAWALVR